MLPTIIQVLRPFRNPNAPSGCGGGTAAGAAGVVGFENNGAGPAAGAFDLGKGTPTAGLDAGGGACIIRVKSPGPLACAGAPPIEGGGAGALKNAVAPALLESAPGFTGPLPADNGPAAGGATLPAAGASPNPGS